MLAERVEKVFQVSCSLIAAAKTPTDSFSQLQALIEDLKVIELDLWYECIKEKNKLDKLDH